MEAIVGLLCLVAPVLFGFGFWAMHQRINSLQDRLFEVELKLKRIEVIPPATQNTVIAAPSTPPGQPAPIAAPGIESPLTPAPEAP